MAGLSTKTWIGAGVWILFWEGAGSGGRLTSYKGSSCLSLRRFLRLLGE